MYDTDYKEEKRKQEILNGLKESRALVGGPACEDGLIKKVIGNIEKRLDTLTGQLDSLYTKINPVLGPSRPKDVGNTNTEGRPLSPLAEELGKIDNRLSDVQLLISDLTERVQL